MFRFVGWLSPLAANASRWALVTNTMQSPSIRIAASRIAVVVLTVTVWVMFFRHVLFADLPLAIAFQVLAAALMLWARLSFGLRSFHAAANPTEGHLVTAGPYRFIRHPIYSAILTFIWAGAISHSMPLNIALALVASLSTLVRMLSEEQLLRARYPEYAAYAARTKRLIPFVF